MVRSFAKLGAVCCALAACGGGRPVAPPVAAPAGPSAAELRARHDREERARRDEIVAAHRKLEDEQQTALAATCTEPAPHPAHERCQPSCYSTEPADPRAGTKLRGPVAIEHLVCRAAGAGADDPLRTLDELGVRLGVRAVHGRFPRPHRKGSWQAEIEARLAAEQPPKPARGDVFVVDGAWRAVTDPRTEERLRCVHVWHYTHAHGVLDACGAGADVACEAAGDPAAHGLNVVHYRLAEARRLQAAGKLADCQQAALEAVAVARGLPRWRQYVSLNVERWVKHAAYRTRFDGMLDVDALFTTAAALAPQAEAAYVACGGPPGAPTTPEQEQSFHTCW